MVAVSASSAEKNVLKTFFDGNGGEFGGWGGTFDKVEEDGKPCLKFSNTEAKDFWAIQMAIDYEYKIGETYYISMDVKGTGDEEITSGFQFAGPNAAGETKYIGCGDMTNFKATSDWKTVVISGTTKAADLDGEEKAPGRWVANLGKYVGDLYITNVTLYTESEGGDTPGTEPGEATKTILKSFYDGNGGTLGGWGGQCTYESVEEDGKPCVKVTNPQEEANDWSCQMAFDYDFEPGVTYYMDFEVKGTVAGTITSGLQNSTSYAGGGNFTDIKITTEWAKQTISCTATAAGDGLPNRWIANFGKYVGTAWFTNVILYTLTDAVDAVVVPVQVNKAVYNLQGVKVADSIDEVSAPGLYITNGKKVIKK